MGRGGGGGSFHSSGSFHSHSSRSSFSSGSSHSGFSSGRSHSSYSSGHSYSSRPGSSYSGRPSGYSRPRPVPPPPPRPHYWGWHRGYYYAGGHGLGNLGFYIIIAALILSMTLITLASELDSGSGANYLPQTSITRTAIDTGIPYEKDCIVDEIGWLKNPDRLGKKLEDFYDLTGCQPYLYLKEYDGDLTTQAAQEAWAREFYDSHFARDPHTVMYVYFCDEADEGHGQDVLWVGPESVKVFDGEVQQLFWQNLDYDWDTWDYNDNDGMFQDVFMKTAKEVIHEVNAQAPVETGTGSSKFVSKAMVCTLLSGAVLVYCFVGRKRSKDAYTGEQEAATTAQNPDFTFNGFVGDPPVEPQVRTAPAPAYTEPSETQLQTTPYSGGSAYAEAPAYSEGSAYATAPQPTSGSYNAQDKQY